MFGLESFFITGFFKLCLGVTGIIMGRLTILFMDREIEKSNSLFAIWVKEDACNQSKGIFYGARYIAIAIIICGALS